VKGAFPAAEATAGTARGAARDLRGSDHPGRGQRCQPVARLDGASPGEWVAGAGTVLPDAVELVGQDRQLLRRAIEQWSDGGSHPVAWVAPVAGLAHAQLSPFSPARPRPFRPPSEGLICNIGEEPKKVYGKGRHRDPVRSTKSYTAYRWGHKWVVLAVLVRFP